MGDQLGEVVALGRRVLRMRAHVEVQPGPVAEKDIGAAPPGHHPPEQIAGNLVRTETPVTMKRAGHTEFSLNPHDPSLHMFELTGWVSVTVRKVGRRFVSCRFVTRYSRSEEHTSELQSLMRISYAVFCLKKKTNNHN